VGETGEWGKCGESDVKFRRGDVVECLAEAGQDLEGKVRQGRVSLFGKDGKRGRPGIDGAGFCVRFHVDGVQPALWKVREKYLSCRRGYADTKCPKRWEERGI
jgi:hypothetical protein